jgi:hypothetical protein
MVLLVRLMHGAITAFFTSCILYVYYAALRRKRGPILYGAIGALVVEGGVVMANGGDCPLGGVHRRYGDDRAFFELLMPQRAAKIAVPVLGAVAVLGIVLSLTRSRSSGGSAS